MIAVLEKQREVLDDKLALGCAPLGLRADQSRARRRPNRRGARLEAQLA